MMAFVGFAMFGFFTSLAPSFVARQLGITSHVVAGAVAFVVFASSAAFQVLSSRWARTTQFAGTQGGQRGRGSPGESHRLKAEKGSSGNPSGVSPCVSCEFPSH